MLRHSSKRKSKPPTNFYFIISYVPVHNKKVHEVLARLRRSDKLQEVQILECTETSVLIIIGSVGQCSLH